MNTSATTVQHVQMEAEISSMLEDVRHNELNFNLLQDIKAEDMDMDIKHEPLNEDIMYYEDNDALLLQHINFSCLKEEYQPVLVEDQPDAIPQARPSECYKCGLSDALIQRRTIITRSFLRKLETHTICHLRI